MKILIIKALVVLLAFKATAQTSDEVVAAVIINEAGGEGLKGMEAVMEVIQNRSVERRLTYYQVVTARFQFSCLNRIGPKGLVQKAKSHSQWPKALSLVKAGYRTNWTRGANHYHAISINPGWPNQTARVGQHVFYRY